MKVMHRIGLSTAAALLLAVTGCGNAGPAQSTAQVRRDASESAKREAEALMDASYAREQARKHALDASARGATADAASARTAALASAETTYATALLRCNAQAGASKASCTERADSERATARARAEAATS
jgi:predicted small lipoprotein YifL